MNRPSVPLSPSAPLGTHKRSSHARSGYTLVEILTATALTLVMMTGVVAILGAVSASISKSRSGLEMMDRLRAAQSTLRRDLQNVTVTMLPPRRIESAEGYFEYIEGPVGVVRFPTDSPPGTAAPEPINSETGGRDTSAGDFDDILMFTVRSPDVPFVGRYYDIGTATMTSLESHEAEIAWFVRGRTLYRRVLLVAPQTLTDIDTNDGDGDGDIDSGDFGAGESFFNLYDISARPVAFSGGETSWVPNSLADLTKRENRFAHRVHYTDVFPYDTRRWLQLRLPTLRECSSPAWMTWPDRSSRPAVSSVSQIDLWTNPHPWAKVDPATGTYYDSSGSNAWNDLRGPRVAEDVILTNVIGFDVKAWDPGAPVILGSTGVALVPGDPGYDQSLRDYVANAQTPTAVPRPIAYGAYVDLNYMCRIGPTYNPTNPPQLPNWVDALRPAGTPTPRFYDAGHPRSGIRGTEPFLPSQSPPLPQELPSVYDTWSFHYEHDGINQYDPPNPSPPPATLYVLTDEGTDGFDNNGNGIVDDVGELETRPPYPYPLRGIQVKIRVFEPDGRQVREVTVVQDFLPK